MKTSVKYCVAWCYREGEATVRRTLHSYKLAPCIEAARLLFGNPYVSDIEVLETDTGKAMDWAVPSTGRVLYDPQPAKDKAFHAGDMEALAKLNKE